jgi:hypothetical protein
VLPLPAQQSRPTHISSTAVLRVNALILIFHMFTVNDTCMLHSSFLTITTCMAYSTTLKLVWYYFHTMLIPVAARCKALIRARFLTLRVPIPRRVWVCASSQCHVVTGGTFHSIYYKWRYTFPMQQTHATHVPF